MLHSVLGAGRGARFLESTVGRPAMAWTVNDESWMEWCVRKNVVNPGPRLLDAVITDDPKQFLQVCRRVEDEAAAGQTPAPGGLWASLNAYRQSLYTTVLGSLAVFVFLRTGRLDYFSDASTLTM